MLYRITRLALLKISDGNNIRLVTRAVNLYRNNRILTCTCQGRSIIGCNYTKPVMHNAYAFTKVDNLADAKA